MVGAGSRRTRRPPRRTATGIALLLVCAAALLALAQPARALTLPPDFREDVVLSGLTQPTGVTFSPDGRIFVAEKRGTVQMYEGLGDTTPTRIADLRTEVHNFWDRGLLGLAVDPGFPARPYLYALYTFDGPVGGTARPSSPRSV